MTRSLRYTRIREIAASGLARGNGGPVRLKVLGAYGSEGPGQRPSAFLVDDRVLVDAGTESAPPTSSTTPSGRTSR